MDKEELTDKQNSIISKLCQVLAVSSVQKLAEEIHKLPIDETQKSSTLLTVITSMLNHTLNIMYDSKTDDDGLLKRKLEFLRVIRHAFVNEHKINKENTDDNG